MAILHVEAAVDAHHEGERRSASVAHAMERTRSVRRRGKEDVVDVRGGKKRADGRARRRVGKDPPPRETWTRRNQARRGGGIGRDFDVEEMARVRTDRRDDVRKKVGNGSVGWNPKEGWNHTLASPRLHELMLTMEAREHVCRSSKRSTRPWRRTGSSSPSNSSRPRLKR